MSSDYRIDEEDVREIIELDEDLDLLPFIRIAHRVVEDHLANNLSVSGLLSDETLEEIELWLSAHFAAIREMRRSQEAVGKANVSYQYFVAADLRNTMYGQQAIVLDHTGTLAAIGQPRKNISFSWLGTESS